jgi:hypothetical protein
MARANPDDRSREPVPPPVDGEIADARRARRWFAGLAFAYTLALALLYAFGLVGFVWKTLVVPALFIVAYAARRFESFVRDWAVFLAAIVLFDSCRGLVYGLIVRWGLPVYMGYALDFEQALFGAPPPSARLQRALLDTGEGPGLEKLLVMVHASHFLVFLFFALLIWLVRQAVFVRFKLAMLLVMYGGIAVYIVLPTVPPWMAAGRFHVVEPIAHVPASVYNLATPALAQSFDVNPVAAMPSLHAAFPALLTLVSFQHFGPWGVAMLGYTLLVFFAIVCLGEHYVVDVLAGCALALLAYLVAYWLPAITRVLAKRGEPASAAPPAVGMLRSASRLRSPLLSTVALLGLAQAAGLSRGALLDRDVPTEAFIRRELDGKSPMAAYFRGLNAFSAGDFARAEPLFAQAISEVPDLPEQENAYLLLGESAYHAADFQTALRTFASQPKLTADHALMLAEARLRLGQRELGFQALDSLVRSNPDDARLRARASQLEHAYGRATR